METVSVAATRASLTDAAAGLANDQQDWVTGTWRKPRATVPQDQIAGMWINPAATVPNAYMQGYRDGMAQLIALLAREGIIADWL